MKKRITLIVVAVVLIALAFLVVTQMDNIKGVFYSFKYSNDDIEKIINENDNALKKDLEDIVGHSIREFTDEENKQIEDGVLTEDEVIEKIVVEELKKKSSTQKSKGDISYYITSLYNLKSQYVGILDGMVTSAVAEYRALSKAEKTRSKQLEIGASYAKKAMALESECDAKVADIVSKIEKQLKSAGQSTEIIGRINSAYDSEKALKRAYYLNMFK